MAAGGDAIMDQDGVKVLSAISHDYSAPEEAGSIYQEVVRSLQSKRTIQMIGEYLVRLDLQRRRAFPEIFAPALCLQHASVPRSGKSLALAAAQGNLGISAAARQMRRFWRRGPLSGCRMRLMEITTLRTNAAWAA